MEQLLSGVAILSLLLAQRKWGANFLSSFALAAVCVYGVASMFH
jgi:hypothetical protein